MRSILSFYKPQNASKKPKLWLFEKFHKKMVLFRKITVGSHWMVQTPKFLYSLESWDHEEYFKLLQTSNRFQKTQVMTIWSCIKLCHFSVTFFCHPFSALGLEGTRPALQHCCARSSPAMLSLRAGALLLKYYFWILCRDKDMGLQYNMGRRLTAIMYHHLMFSTVFIIILFIYRLS